jgi:hypothetical protein
LSRYPEDFNSFLDFLCKKYSVARSRVFIEFSSNPPPPIQGGRPGFYDGLLSYRKKDGQVEFLITVFEIAQDPLLTLGHEFAHLVEDLKQGSIDSQLRPPDDVRERKFDEQSMRDLREFRVEEKLR